MGIILLNGPSSAGKSSIARGLQARLPEAFLHFRMDAFWDMVPEHIEANSNNFPQMKAAIIDSARALAKHGHNLIIDIVAMPAQMAALHDALRDYDPHVVAVTAELSVLQAREAARGDRTIGLSESQYRTVHQDFAYDQRIDTTYLTPEEAADAIVQQYRPVAVWPGPPAATP